MGNWGFRTGKTHKPKPKVWNIFFFTKLGMYVICTLPNNVCTQVAHGWMIMFFNMTLMKEIGIKVCKLMNGTSHITNAICGVNLCYNKYTLLSLIFCLQMVTWIQHLQTSMSSPIDENYQKSISKRSKTIEPIIKSRCAMTIQGAHTHAPSTNIGKAHMHMMHDYGH